MADWIIPLVTLTAMEIVLGIDNIIFLAIVAGKLPPEQQPKARQLGLAAALVTRILLLLAINWVLQLNNTLLSLPDWIFTDEKVRFLSGKDLILIVGGLFLIGKSTHEIHSKLEGEDHPDAPVPGKAASFGMILVQIAILDIVFSLDSVITAVGMVRDIRVIIAAMFVTVGVMLIFAGPVSNFVARHPTLKVLALSFLILIGVLLVAEGFDQHINKGYIYFAMAFSFVVEMVNLRVRHKQAAVKLRGPEMPAKVSSESGMST